MSLRLTLICAGIASVLLVWIYVGHLREKVASETARADAAERAASMRSVETKTVEHFHEKERVITQQAERSADAVAQIPSDDVPADVLAGWLGGLRNVRAAAPDSGSADPPR